MSAKGVISPDDSPLTGVRVLDLTRFLAGPFCTMLLADMGADVLKVEPPRGGDPLREQGARREGLSWYYAAYNRNKRSLTLDARAPESREVLRRLVAKSDVVVENFRPGVMAKMGLDYPRLAKIRPGIIHCAITGYGADGPYADRPAFDFITQAVSGLMSVNGAEGTEPLRVGIPISDLVSGLYAALAVTAALRRRDLTGEGESVQTALNDGLVSLLSYMSANYLATGEVPQRTGNDHPIVAPYGLFEASDGPLALAPSNEAIYQRLLEALELTELRTDPDFATNDRRLANRERINARVQERIGTRPRAHWLEALNRAGVPAGVPQRMDEVFEDPQVLHQGDAPRRRPPRPRRREDARVPA
jgi:crotonobetainyl-CoA:carnitine CoA-transferase CaiB-like acyl-CoA transferase